MIDYGAQIVFLLGIIIVLLFGITAAFFAIPGPKETTRKQTSKK